MSIEESRTLRKRAGVFLRHSQEALQREEYDFACFSAEQAAQLYVKAAALELLGEIPRVHRTRELLSILADAIPAAKDEIKLFIKENRGGLRLLEEAYIASRYLPSTYDREEAKVAVGLARRMVNLCRRVTKGSR